jgi:hypothetical protein
MALRYRTNGPVCSNAGEQWARDWNSQGKLRAVPNPIDGRAKLIDHSDLERLTHYTENGAASGETAPSSAYGQVHQPEAPDPGEETPPWPLTVGAYRLGVPSDQYEDWLRGNWRPE